MEQNPISSSCQCSDRAHKIFFIVLIALLLVIGNALSGWFIGHGLYKMRISDKYVSVKGIAEKQVKADLAIWEVNYKAAGNDLQQVNNQVGENQKAVQAFLLQQGLATNEFEVQATTVVDKYAQEYESQKAEQRYIVNGSIKVRTDKVDLVRKISQNSQELIKAGVVLASKEYQQANPSYVFTKLDELRPTMLAQATKSARLVAEQFAADSHSHVGAIRRASQGVFQILSSDSSAGESYSSARAQAADINKTVRVVSSIDYFLAN
ncbi:MAG: SIMPL domain-containing protein [Gammaproteobacteria bacterium]